MLVVLSKQPDVEMNHGAHPQMFIALKFVDRPMHEGTRTVPYYFVGVLLELR